MGKHHNDYEKGLVDLMLHYRNAREHRKQTLKVQSAKLYIGALRAINRQRPLTSLEYLRTEKASILEQIKAAPLATGKNWAAAAATVLFSLIASGKGAGWEPVQKEYYRLSQQLSKTQQAHQASNPGLSDVQREMWVSLQDIEVKVVAPLKRLVDEAGIATRPLKDMGMADFLLARSYFLVMSFVGQPPPRPSSLAPMWTVGEYHRRGMAKDRNWIVLTGSHAYTVIFNVHKTMSSQPQIVFDVAGPMFSRYREALHLYLPLRNKMLGLPANATQPAPLYITSQGKQMSSHDLGKELLQTTETAVGKRVGARVLRTVFASSMYQACAYSDSGIGLVEAAKRLGHSVKTSLLSYVKRVDDPTLSLAAPVRAPVPAESALFANKAHTKPVGKRPPARQPTVTRRGSPQRLRAPKHVPSPRRLMLRQDEGGHWSPSLPGSAAPPRRTFSNQPVRNRSPTAAKTVYSRPGRRIRTPRRLLWGDDESIVAAPSVRRASPNRRRTPKRPASTTHRSPRRWSSPNLAGGAMLDKPTPEELWRLPLRPVYSDLSISDLHLRTRARN